MTRYLAQKTPQIDSQRSQQHQCSTEARGTYVDLLHLAVKGCNARSSPYTARGVYVSSAGKTIEAQRRIWE